MEIIVSRRFKQIRASIGKIGLIEPLSVNAADPATGQYVLLDGHLRLRAMQDLGCIEAPCLVATDDESYTYNANLEQRASAFVHPLKKRVTPSVELPFPSKQPILKSKAIDAVEAVGLVLACFTSGLVPSRGVHRYTR
ncbi:hypothetical protein A6V36_01780 [Paraburkholderia ginsengiterrae]|uniref:ParB-like N-terminal domain-containing protein n=1 Tax=Paraburkholderia ginsengiterrae TaxID=1462993 RepID=A0ABX2UZZ4_9BURK|nr:hypothetical protein A6V36_01780 [Paraburkholderia ginsengiterrae]